MFGIPRGRTTSLVAAEFWSLWLHISLDYSEACDSKFLSGLWASLELNLIMAFYYVLVKIENWLSHIRNWVKCLWQVIQITCATYWGGAHISILCLRGLMISSSILCSPLDENWFHEGHDQLRNEVSIMIIMPCIVLVEILWAQGKGMYLHLCIVSAFKAPYMLEYTFVWHRIDVFSKIPN